MKTVIGVLMLAIVLCFMELPFVLGALEHTGLKQLLSR